MADSLSRFAFPLPLGPQGPTLVMSETQTIEQRVIKLVCNNMKAKQENVTMETSFVNDLGTDSLDTVELVMELEEEFGLTIPDEDAANITTVGNAVDYVKAKS